MLIVLAALESALEVAVRHDAPQAPTHDALVRRPGGRAHRAAAARAPALPVRRARGGLAAGRGALVRRRAARRVHRRRVRRRDGRGVPARQPPRRRRRRGSAWRSCSAARRSSSTTTPTTPPASSSSSRSCSRSAGSPASRCASGPRRPRRRRSARPRPSGSARRPPRIAVAEERARIARELHDIVAHAVSVMVLQVGAVRHRLPDDARRGPGGAPGRRAGRPHRARRDAPPARRDAQRRRRGRARAPARSRQPRLAAGRGRPRRACPCGCTSRASPVPLPRAIDLSAYRIVQEGLTNALKHARAEPGRRDRPLRRRRARRSRSATTARGASTSDGLGHGLVGIRERVKIYGGEMTAGAATGGGFVLSTRLPLDGDGR